MTTAPEVDVLGTYQAWQASLQSGLALKSARLQIADASTLAPRSARAGVGGEQRSSPAG